MRGSPRARRPRHAPLDEMMGRVTAEPTSRRAEIANGHPPPAVPGRSGRRRRPPDRFGVWLLVRASGSSSPKPGSRARRRRARDTRRSEVARPLVVVADLLGRPALRSHVRADEDGRRPGLHPLPAARSARRSGRAVSDRRNYPIANAYTVTTTLAGRERRDSRGCPGRGRRFLRHELADERLPRVSGHELRRSRCTTRPPGRRAASSSRGDRTGFDRPADRRAPSRPRRPCPS